MLGNFDSQLNLSNKVGAINNAQSGTINNDITIKLNGSVGTLANEGTMQNITIQQQGISRKYHKFRHYERYY